MTLFLRFMLFYLSFEIYSNFVFGNDLIKVKKYRNPSFTIHETDFEKLESVKPKSVNNPEKINEKNIKVGNHQEKSINEKWKKRKKKNEIKPKEKKLPKGISIELKENKENSNFHLNYFAKDHRTQR